VYDLVILAPVFLLVLDWTLGIAETPLRNVMFGLLAASYLLPIVFPLTAVTHVQLSVIAFTGLAVLLWRTTKAMSVG
jgi:hypothetical protein